ncbi:hypothetical protein PGB90_003496 [Kerria lacca]
MKLRSAKMNVILFYSKLILNILGLRIRFRSSRNNISSAVIRRSYFSLFSIR